MITPTWLQEHFTAPKSELDPVTFGPRALHFLECPRYVAYDGRAWLFGTDHHIGVGLRVYFAPSDEICPIPEGILPLFRAPDRPTDMGARTTVGDLRRFIPRGVGPEWDEQWGPERAGWLIPKAERIQFEGCMIDAAKLARVLEPHLNGEKVYIGTRTIRMRELDGRRIRFPILIGVGWRAMIAPLDPVAYERGEP